MHGCHNTNESELIIGSERVNTRILILCLFKVYLEKMTKKLKVHVSRGYLLVMISK